MLPEGQIVQVVIPARGANVLWLQAKHTAEEFEAARGLYLPARHGILEMAETKGQ